MNWPEELPDDVAWSLEGMLCPARNREWYRKLREAMLAREEVTKEPEYGSTEFGWTFAGITLTDGDKRLMSLLVQALGSDHPAIDDMVSLLFSRRSASTPDHKQEDNHG